MVADKGHGANSVSRAEMTSRAEMASRAEMVSRAKMTSRAEIAVFVHARGDLGVIKLNDFPISYRT